MMEFLMCIDEAQSVGKTQTDKRLNRGFAKNRLLEGQKMIVQWWLTKKDMIKDLNTTMQKENG